MLAHRNPFWEIVKSAITPIPNAMQTACHAPKPILLNTVSFSCFLSVIASSLTLAYPQGYAHTPYDWSPSTVNIQLLRVGQLVMIIMPGELTTMAGRRLRWASFSLPPPVANTPFTEQQSRLQRSQLAYPTPWSSSLVQRIRPAITSPLVKSTLCSGMKVSTHGYISIFIYLL